MLWVHFWVHFRKTTPLDDANSFLFNAYSVSSKKVYAIRAPDHPPQASEKSEVFLFRNVEISAFRKWYQLIRSIDRVSLEVLHFSKKCYSPGGAMTAGILLLCQCFFEKLLLLCIRCPVVTVVEIGSPFICMACI